MWSSQGKQAPSLAELVKLNSQVKLYTSWLPTPWGCFPAYSGLKNEGNFVILVGVIKVFVYIAGQAGAGRPPTGSS